MTIGRFRKLRRRKVHRRHRTIWDRRGLPARQITAQVASKGFDQLLSWVQRNDLCVITDGRKRACVLLSNKAYEELTGSMYVPLVVSAERKRNPGGIFTLADEIFGDARSTDLWMASRLWGFADEMPENQFAPEEVEEIRSLLHKTRNGFIA